MLISVKRPSFRILRAFPKLGKLYDEKVPRPIRAWAPHIFLIAICVLYISVGGYIFRLIELQRPPAKHTTTTPMPTTTAFVAPTRRSFLSYFQFSTAPPTTTAAAPINDAEVLPPSPPSSGVNSSVRLAEEEWEMWSAVFFTFTTITTIGYGNISPGSDGSRVFCFAYCLLGIPLFGLCLADLVRFVTAAAWRTQLLILKRRHAFREKRRRKKQKLEERAVEDETTPAPPKDGEEVVLPLKHRISPDDPLPLWFVGLCLGSWLVFGMFLFSALEGYNYVQAFYYSFVSITTIGYGDFVPVKKKYYIVDMLYLYVGMGLNLMGLQGMGAILQRLHYSGQDKVEDGINRKIWFNGEQFTMEELIEMLGRKFNVAEEDIKKATQNFDDVINSEIDRRKDVVEDEEDKGTEAETVTTASHSHTTEITPEEVIDKFEMPVKRDDPVSVVFNVRRMHKGELSDIFDPLDKNRKMRVDASGSQPPRSISRIGVTKEDLVGTMVELDP